jgi:hypothetical protein
LPAEDELFAAYAARACNSCRGRFPLADCVVESLVLLELVALVLSDELAWLDESQDGGGGGGGANDACDESDVEDVDDVESLADARAVKNVLRSVTSWLSSVLLLLDVEDDDELSEDVAVVVDAEVIDSRSETS